MTSERAQELAAWLQSPAGSGAPSVPSVGTAERCEI